MLYQLSYRPGATYRKVYSLNITYSERATIATND